MSKETTTAEKVAAFLILTPIFLVVFVMILGFIVGDPKGNTTSSNPSPPVSASASLPDHIPPRPSLRVSDDKKVAAIENAVFDAFLKFCPTIKGAMAPNGNVSVEYNSHGLVSDGETRHSTILFEMDLPQETYDTLPAGLRDPQWSGHLMYYVDPKNRGVWANWPPALWLCGMPLDEDLVSGFTRTWHQRNIFAPMPQLKGIHF